MARFKGQAPGRTDLFIPVAFGALVLVAVILVAWSLIDHTGFMIWWDSLGASVHR